MYIVGTYFETVKVVDINMAVYLFILLFMYNVEVTGNVTV